MKLKLISLAAAAAVCALAVSCQKEPKQSDDTRNALTVEVLKNVSNNVIMATYTDLEKLADQHLKAIKAFRATPNDANLKVVKDTWRAARVAWEQSEAFLFGPTDQQGLDPAMDSWPVDQVEMDAMLKGNDPITAESIAANNDTRGFHLLEYIIWGESGNKAIADFTSRELEMMEAAGEDLYNNTATLKKEWSTFVFGLINAGMEGNGKYPSTRSGIQELVEGMSSISNEVANDKIDEPLNGKGDGKDGKPHPDLEESRFCHNSKTDYVNNFESIYNIYTGSYKNHSGKGVADILISLGQKELNEKTIKAIKASQAAINAIPGTFTDAIKIDNPEGRKAVAAARDAAAELSTILEKEVLPAIVNAPADKI